MTKFYQPIYPTEYKMPVKPSFGIGWIQCEIGLKTFQTLPKVTIIDHEINKIIRQ